MVDQEFRLTWVNYSEKLTESFHKFLTNESLCNVTLSVHRKSIKAHQSILSACSPWFEQLLLENQHPHPIIILKDVRYLDLKNIIRFIYTGEVSVHQNDLQDFLRTAELLEIKGLLKNNTDEESSFSTLVYASPGSSSPAQPQVSAPIPQAPPPPPQNQVAPANMPPLPTVPISSLLLNSSNLDGTSPINELVSQIKVPISINDSLLNGNNGINHQITAPPPPPGPQQTNKKRKNSSVGTDGKKHSTISKRRNIATINNHHSNSNHNNNSHNNNNHNNTNVNNPPPVASLSSGYSTPETNQLILDSNQQQIVVGDMNCSTVPTSSASNITGGTVPNGSQCDVSDSPVPSIMTHSSVDEDGGGGDCSWLQDTKESISTFEEQHNNSQQLTAAELVATGINDCGPFKRIWSERYLCYNLGREIICLLCFCRFTQFKKFNLERHMRNKHAQLYNLSESSRKHILERYVARYEEHVTPGMVASVPTHGSETMATEIMSMGPIHLEDLDLDLDVTQSIFNTGTRVVTAGPDEDVTTSTTNGNTNIGGNGGGTSDPGSVLISNHPSPTLPQDHHLMVECELEEQEGEILLVKQEKAYSL